MPTEDLETRVNRDFPDTWFRICRFSWSTVAIDVGYRLVTMSDLGLPLGGPVQKWREKLVDIKTV